MNELFDSGAAAVDSSQAEKIFRCYPRKIGRLKALKKIEAALRKVPFDQLLAKVQAFAKSPKGQSGLFCPYPATWFADGRYLDDPAEWQLVTKPEPQKPAPRPVPKAPVIKMNAIEQLEYARRLVVDRARDKLKSSEFRALGNSENVIAMMKDSFPEDSAVKQLIIAEQKQGEATQ